MKLATVEVLAAALRPELEKNGLGWSYGRVELVLGGAIDGGAQGGAAGVLRRLGKGVGTMNLEGDQAQRRRARGKQMELVSRWGGLNRERRQRPASTSPGDAGRQAGCVPARAHVALRARRPCWTGGW